MCALGFKHRFIVDDDERLTHWQQADVSGDWKDERQEEFFSPKIEYSFS